MHSQGREHGGSWGTGVRQGEGCGSPCLNFPLPPSAAQRTGCAWFLSNPSPQARLHPFLTSANVMQISSMSTSASAPAPARPGAACPPGPDPVPEAAPPPAGAVAPPLLLPPPPAADPAAAPPPPRVWPSTTNTPCSMASCDVWCEVWSEVWCGVGCGVGCGLEPRVKAQVTGVRWENTCGRGGDPLDAVCEVWWCGAMQRGARHHRGPRGKPSGRGWVRASARTCTLPPPHIHTSRCCIAHTLTSLHRLAFLFAL